MIKPKKIKTPSYTQKYICKKCDNFFKHIQKELQKEENIKYGRKARTINYVVATEYVYKRYLK